MHKTWMLLLAALPGCSTYEVLTGRCNVEFIDLDWPVTITQGAASSTDVLLQRLSPSNISIDEFDMLKGALIEGETQRALAAVWSTSAFNVNGGYIAFVHRVPLSDGETVPIVSAFDGGGWGMLSGLPGSAATAAVRAGNFTATSAKGTLQVLDAAPLKLRVDLTATSGSGQNMRIQGDAAFSLRRETVACS